LKGASENIVAPEWSGITSGDITSHPPGASQSDKYALVMEEGPAKEHENLAQAEEHSTYIHITDNLTEDLVVELLKRNPESIPQDRSLLPPYLQIFSHVTSFFILSISYLFMIWCLSSSTAHTQHLAFTGFPRAIEKQPFDSHISKVAETGSRNEKTIVKVGKKLDKVGIVPSVIKESVADVEDVEDSQSMRIVAC
jgi:hypothetical protein